MNPIDTLSGTYVTGKLVMADGTEQPVLVRKIPRGDGSFGTVIIDDAAIEFEQRYANTDCAPNDHVPANTEVLTKKVAETISHEDTTHRYISGDLIQFLGDPDRILAQGGLDPERLAHMKQHPASLTMARRLCTLGGHKWQRVLALLPKFYPETRK